MIQFFKRLLISPLMLLLALCIVPLGWVCWLLANEFPDWLDQIEAIPKSLAEWADK